MKSPFLLTVRQLLLKTANYGARRAAQEEDNFDDDGVLLLDDEDETSLTELVIAIGIFFLMVGVGMNCRAKLFRKFLKSPKALQAAAIGVTCQFCIMPVVSYLITIIFQLDGYTALGVLLVGCMPGGSSSNVFTMWCGGVLELSVFMTVISTILAFGMTPLWLFLLTKGIANFDETTALGYDEIAITFALLIIPLTIGVAISNCFKCAKRILPYVEKFVSALAILVFVAAIVLLIIENPDALSQYLDWKIGIAAVAYFPISTTLSYAITSFLKFAPALRRTVVMEVGLQNLALGFAIGLQTVTKQSQLDEALPFPILYAIFMYAFAALLIPVFRCQKWHNEKTGVSDNDPNFFLLDDENDLDDDDDDSNTSSGMKEDDDAKDDNNQESLEMENNEMSTAESNIYWDIAKDENSSAVP